MVGIEASFDCQSPDPILLPTVTTLWQASGAFGGGGVGNGRRHQQWQQVFKDGPWQE